MKTLQILVCVILSIGLHTHSHAQDYKYVSAKIKMVDGNNLEGVVRLPVNNEIDKVAFRSSLDGEKSIIKSNDIDFIMFNSEDSNILLKRSQYYKVNKQKVGKKKFWMSMDLSCENFQGYILLYGITVDKEGKLYHTYNEAGGRYLIQRIGEDYPTGVGGYFHYIPITHKMFDKQRSGLLKKYYSNDPEALKHFSKMKRISQEEFADFLNSRCENDESK